MNGSESHFVMKTKKQEMRRKMILSFCITLRKAKRVLNAKQRQNQMVTL